MCGIAGFLSFDRQALNPSQRQQILVAMGDMLEHRGPDDVGYYDDGALSLVCRRLSIVDTAHGHQPLFNRDHSLLIGINGEIYNHDELRQQLAGRQHFATRCDSEVPLHLVAEHGKDGLKLLNGMFALAVWDIRERKLLLARDAIGIKPLYVCQLPGGLLFASELKALLMHPDCPRELDWSALYYGPQTRSPVASYMQGIDFLPGGCYLEATADGQVQRGSFWKLDDHLGSAVFGHDAAAYSQHFGDLIEDATLSHLMGEPPVALHLSGGADSSLLAAIAARHGAALPCFSVVERTIYRAGDVAAAEKVTQSLGLPWYPVLYDYRSFADDIDFTLERFEQTVWMMDSPRFDLEWLFKEELHRFARTQIPGLKVVLLGQGADEFAGGYSRRLGSHHAGWQEYIRDEILHDLKAQRGWELRISSDISEALPLPFDFSGNRGPYHEKMRQLSYQLKHFNLWHEDRSSASQSLEARVPFLDRRIVELLASVPQQLHAELFWDKRIVRQALQRHFPQYDAARRKVAFFATDDVRSVALILNRVARRVAADFRDKYLADAHFPLERETVGRLIDRVLTSREPASQDSWQLMEYMAIAIFERQIRTAGKEVFRQVRRSASRLELVAAGQWDAIAQAFNAEPKQPLKPVVAKVVATAKPLAAAHAEVAKPRGTAAPAKPPATVQPLKKTKPPSGEEQAAAKQQPVADKKAGFGLLAWFDCSDVEQFASRFVADMVRAIPPAMVNGGDHTVQGKVPGKAAKKIGSMLVELMNYRKKHALNFYKKAQLANKVRWHMKEAGYAAEFTESVSREMAMLLARG